MGLDELRFNMEANGARYLSPSDPEFHLETSPVLAHRALDRP